MDSKYDFEKLGNERKVYVRIVEKSELPQELQDKTDDLEIVYAIYSEDGEQLALAKNRELAFAVARTNDFTPVSVH
jgi:hypothetical protein